MVQILRYERYPLNRPEVALAALAVVGVGILLSALAALRPRTLRPAMVGLLLAILVNWRFADSFVGFVGLLGNPGPLRQIVEIAILVLIPVLSLSLTWVIRAHLTPIALAAFGTLLGTTILLPVTAPRYGEVSAGEVLADPSATQSRVLHLVLDEMIGVDGIPADIEGGPELRQDLTEFYLRFGFTLYPRAWSISAETQLALDALLNGEGAPGRVGVSPIVPGYRLGRNAWFDRLSSRGQTIRVYQSDWVDYCGGDGARPSSCVVYPNNALAPLVEASVPVGTKTVLLLGRVCGTMRLCPPARQPQLSALASMQILDDLLADDDVLPAGTAIFAHLLLPHFAYVYDPSCHLRPLATGWPNVSPAFLNKTPEGNTVESRSERYVHYVAQVRCLHDRLGRLFQRLKDGGVWDETIVVVHGDHGSRIALHNFRNVDPTRLSERDVIDLYSTLFAVRVPGLAAGAVATQRSIQSLFAELLLERPIPNEPSELYMRMLVPGGQEFRSRPMVEIGGGSGSRSGLQRIPRG